MGSIVDLMQPEFVSTGEGRAVLRFRPRDEWKIPSGVVQGGITTVMLDMAMAVAGGGISTASIQVDILRPVVGDVLTATGTITRAGKRIVFAEATLTNEEGTLLARGVQTAVPPAG